MRVTIVNAVKASVFCLAAFAIAPGRAFAETACIWCGGTNTTTTNGGTTACGGCGRISS